MSRRGKAAELEAASARIAAVCPRFRNPTWLRRSLKCLLVAGQLDGRPAVAKVLVHEDPLWRWYFSREPQVIAALPDGALTPILREDHVERGIFISDRASGSPLSSTRRLSREIGAGILRTLLAATELYNGVRWPRAASGARSDSVTRAMRRRLLEDPDDGLDWFVSGFGRCADLGIVSPSASNEMTAALRRYPRAAFCHGDLLARNVVVAGDRVRVIDWECGGLHARDWDRALLWAAVVPSQRHAIESRVDDSPERRAAFFSLAAFAVAREIKFARRSRSRFSRARLDDLDAALARL